MLWSANDDPTGRPKYANVASVYGVNATEAVVKGKSAAPGWVKVTYGTGSVDLVLTAGGSGYTNADIITVDGVATVGVVNATANVIVGFGANVATSTLAVVYGRCFTADHLRQR
jgi:molybdopterin biosynthesis enzyme MoaB